MPFKRVHLSNPIVFITFAVKSERMKKVLYFVFLCSFLLTACSQKKKYKIGVSQCSEDIWREKLNDEILNSAYLYDNLKIEIASANESDKQQVAQIDKFVKDGVDLLIVSPNKQSTITPAIVRAYKKGIPVILFDHKINSDQYTSYIGADNVNIGREMGNFLARKTGGKARIVEITGLPGSTSASERHKGFVEALKNYPGMEIVQQRRGDWQPKSARIAMDSVLRSGVDFDCVFAHNDRMAIAARNVVEEHAINRKITYIGIDGLPVPGGGMDNVRDGRLAASYIYPTRGDLVVQLAMNILNHEPYKKMNNLKGALISQDNIDIVNVQSDEISQQYYSLYKMHDKANHYLAQYSHQRIYLMMSIAIVVLLIVMFVMLYRNIMFKRRMAEQVSNARLQFFTNVSHEFRTPLTLIADPIEKLLDEGNINDQQRSLLLLSRKNVNVMLRLVNEILDLRKVQSGKMRLTLSQFNIGKAMTDWINGFAVSAKRKNIRLQLDIDAPVTITADYYKLERICYNLLSNALKYTKEGGTVTFSATADEQQVSIQVKDTGIGMSKEQEKHVFDNFYQANNGMNGTGIGLAIVKAFVELHQGSVGVESALGKGSVFTVTLPRKQEGTITELNPTLYNDFRYIPADVEEDMTTEKEPTLKDHITSPDETMEQKTTILVIDDNKDVRDYVATLLSVDYAVIKAEDGEQGVEKALKEVPDLIICDVMMPGISGLEVCRKLKKETATSHIPIILLTARSMDDQQVEGYDCGADAYLTKPFNGKVLRACVKNLLDTRRQLKSLYTSDEPAEIPAPDGDTQFINNFHAIVVKRMADADLSVENISRELGLSRVQMYRKIKALTGSTPVELVRITRLKKAERLLRQKGKTVSEVAYEVGFSSPSYFAKCYKDYFGKQPSEISPQ